jgi:uncharacterized protein
MNRLAPTVRPQRPRQGSQRWHRLLFIHWEVSVDALRPLVDPRLTIDTFEGKAFVGLVAFTMQKVTPYDWLPRFPTATQFGEINLRTYVHHRGAEPGVWFLSLDAASSLVVAAARALWHLPYHRANIECLESDSHIAFRSTRHWPPPAAAPFACSAVVAEAMAPPLPDSSDFFFAERYQFYTSSGRQVLRARVHHRPYSLHRVRDVSVDTALVAAAGLLPVGALTGTAFSPGVDVDIFSMEKVE